MRILPVEVVRQGAVVAHMVQIVDVDVDRPCSSDSASVAKPIAASMTRVLVKVVSAFRRAHVRRVVVGDSNDGYVSVGVWVGKGNHRVISVSGRTTVSRLIDLKLSQVHIIVYQTVDVRAGARNEEAWPHTRCRAQRGEVARPAPRWIRGGPQQER